MAWDPQDDGADCASCWLYTRREGRPVPSEFGGRIAVVAEAPGRDECEVGRPLVGRSGQELMTAFGVNGLRRSDASYINTISCRPPSNEMAKMEFALNGENRRRKKLNRALAPGEEPYKILPHPVTCCRKRLVKDLAGFTRVLTLGDTAFRAVTGSEHAITKMRGSAMSGWFDPDENGRFIDVEQGELAQPPGAPLVKILPTFHPALVLRQRMWTAVFRGDIGRAIRWFENRRNWKDPEVVIRPTLPELIAFLARPERFFAWDLETNGKEPLTAKIRCFGVGTRDRVFVVPLLSTNGTTKFYTAEDEREIRAVLARFLADPKILKAGWNSGLYDRAVAEKQLGVTPRKSFDGILAHHVTDSEMPHNLGFAGTTLTDVVAWKQDSQDVLNCSDEVLWERNWKDVAVTACLVEPLENALVLKDQAAVCAKDHKVQTICAGMHRTGLLIDPAARDAHGKRLLRELLHNLKLIRDATGNPKFNPNSTPQISDLLFTDWGLPPVKLSEKTGAPSTDNDALRTYRVQYNLTDTQKKVIEAIRKVRKAVKYRGTVILKLVRNGEHVQEDEWAEDEEETEEEREFRRKKDLKKKGILLADGRVHSTFSNHVASTGRLSSSDPMNVQNVDRKLRDMFVPAPGNVYVGADLDQVEVRYAAAHWQMQHMIQVFKENRDPHYETMLAVFGKAAQEAKARALAWAAAGLDPNGKPRKFKDFLDFKKMRDFAKRFRFGVQYGAQDKTVHKVISSVEDDDGNLVYADVSLLECANRRRALLDADPEYEVAWANEIATWRKQGFIAERIWGRKRYFLNGEPDSDDETADNEIRNFPIQAACAAIIHEATFDLVDAIPFEKWGPGTGLVNQIHDALVVECPEKEAKRTAGILMECMTRTYPGLDVQFKAEAKWGRRWSDV